MTSAVDLSGSVAFDVNSLNSLKNASKENSPEAIKGVAKQFEAIFMNMMLKSMREASPQDSPFDSEQSRTFTAMLDQQLSSNLASKGLGLADVLAKQLTKSSMGANVVGPAADELSPVSSYDFQDYKLALASRKKFTEQSIASYELNAKPLSDEAAAFKSNMMKHAQEASLVTGIPAHLMLGQAALESGWGKRELKAADGTQSNNLFGIKASGNWDGKVIEATTTEYINGIKQKRIEKFRAYDSYADSFKDFANMISKNARYEKVMDHLDNANAYALSMQRAGYATDPQYANKLASVIKKVVA